MVTAIPNAIDPDRLKALQEYRDAAAIPNTDARYNNREVVAKRLA
jgi:hypothetical protein